LWSSVWVSRDYETKGRLFRLSALTNGIRGDACVSCEENPDLLNTHAFQALMVNQLELEPQTKFFSQLDIGKGEGKFVPVLN
jgi:hypothetical protein